MGQEATKEPPAPKARSATPAIAKPGATRIARMLAMVYFIERQLEAGAIRDYAEAARRLGISRARMTQVMNLLTLPTATQEDILAGTEVSERGLRERKTNLPPI